MYLIRDVFHCKPGKSRAVADLFKNASPSMEKTAGFKGFRVMVDTVADYWTVVLESEAEDLGEYEKSMDEYRNRPQMREALKGYMDMVEGGRREIFKVL